MYHKRVGDTTSDPSQGLSQATVCIRLRLGRTLDKGIRRLQNDLCKKNLRPG